MKPFLSLRLAESTNGYFASAVREIPGYQAACAVFDEATERLTQVGQDIPTVETPDPLSVGKITDEWLQATVDQARASADAALLRSSLEQVRDRARSDAEAIVTVHVDDIAARLSDDLDELITDTAAAVEKLGDARTATDAVRAKAGEAWTTLADLAAEYQQIRAVQMMITDLDVVERCRMSWAPDPAATDLHFRNLDQFWPAWRQYPRSDGTLGQRGARFDPPWPDIIDQPAEFMAWLIDSPAEPWIPNSKQLNELHASRKPKVVRPTNGIRQLLNQGQSESARRDNLGVLATRSGGYLAQRSL